MTDELMALADRVEALAGPCRETDVAVALAKGWLRTAGEGWFRPPGLTVSHHKTELPRFTSSLDAAMTLVPEGYGWRVEKIGGGRSLAIVGGRIHLPWRECATPALALTAAALRAIAAKETEA